MLGKLDLCFYRNINGELYVLKYSEFLKNFQKTYISIYRETSKT